VQAGCHKLYCERVVNDKAELLVEDLVKFGLGVYFGVPLLSNDEVIGTVCALNDKQFDFSKGEPSAIVAIRTLKQEIEILLS